MARRPDHLRLVAATERPALSAGELAHIHRLVDLEAARPKPAHAPDFVIGRMASETRWRPFAGVVWCTPPSLFDRLFRRG